MGELVSQIPLVGLEVVPPGPAQFCGKAQEEEAHNTITRVVAARSEHETGCDTELTTGGTPGVCDFFMREAGLGGLVFVFATGKRLYFVSIVLLVGYHGASDAGLGE